MGLEATLVSVAVRINGADIGDSERDLVSKITVENEITLPDLAVIHFDDRAGDVLSKVGAAIGRSLEVLVSTDGGRQQVSVFVGEITAIEAVIENEHRLSVIRGYDLSHRLQRGRVSKTHEGKTIGDVVGEVAARHSLTGNDSGRARWVNKHLVQWNESDWEFLNRLAADSGHEVAIDADGKLAFREPKPASGGPGEGSRHQVGPLQLVQGENLLRIRAGVTAGDVVRTVEVRGWDPANKKEVVESVPVSKARVHDSRANPKTVASDIGAKVLVRTDLPFESPEPAKAAAEGIAEQLGATVAEVEGLSFGDPHMRAGAVVNISGVGQPFDGKHTLTSCRHVLSPDASYTTEFRSSGTQRRGLLGLATSGGGRASNVVHGVVPAVVTDIADPERMGRVRVGFPWLGDHAVSPWSRVLHPGAGPERGMVFLPEVNDEVLVAFHQGNTQMPYILGGLYNGKDRSPADLLKENEVAKRVLVSREKHRLEFDDGDKRILLSSGDDKLQIEMDQNDTKITITSAGEIEITSDGDLRLEAKGELAMKANGVSIDAGAGAFEAKGTTAKIEGSSSAELSGAQAKVEGQAMAEIKGGLVKIN